MQSTRGRHAIPGDDKEEYVCQEPLTARRSCLRRQVGGRASKVPENHKGEHFCNSCQRWKHQRSSSIVLAVVIHSVTKKDSSGLEKASNRGKSSYLEHIKIHLTASARCPRDCTMPQLWLHAHSKELWFWSHVSAKEVSGRQTKMVVQHLNLDKENVLNKRPGTSCNVI